MNIKSTQYHLAGLIVGVMILMSGCYPKGPEFVSDYALVVTDYEPGTDFGSKKTYFMPDTIYIETNLEDVDEETVREFEDLIINTIAQNMSDRNYDRVDTTATEEPDLVITVTAIALRNAGVGWVPGPGWGWWGPPGWGWGPGWGWWGPGWWPVAYSWNTGTVIIYMGDPDKIIEDEFVELSWVAFMDGLLSSSVDNNQQGVENGINQAFTQSPYIQSNQ